MMQKIDRLLEFLLSALLTLMVLDVTWQILTRFLPMDPSSFTEELARYLLVWIGILGAAYAYRKKSHIGIDLLTNKLSPKTQKGAQLFAILTCLLFASAVMVFGGIQLVLLTFELNQMSAALNIPMGYVYLVMPLSGMLICIFCVEQLMQALGGAGAPLESADHNAEVASAQV